MTKRTLTIVVIVGLLITLINSVMIFMDHNRGKKTVVIDVIRVFNEFKMKKDLESRVAVQLTALSDQVDSLKAVYNDVFKRNANDPRLEPLAADVDTLQARGQRAYTISDKTINEQVWMRLNTLINEFGAQYDYQLMIGANGMGTVLYNKKDLDKTEDLIKFINAKYELGH
jgi:Skp family chaperone for outer membrane proteins